jgi:ADP-ribose pyrophosphatase YjhB (NUDIX family)
MESNESPIDTAKRELLEETGLEEFSLINHQSLYNNYQTTINGNQVSKMVFYFIGVAQSLELTCIVSKSEIDVAQRLPIKNALDLCTHPETKTLILSWKQMYDTWHSESKHKRPETNP